jgi:hypothetical protein
VFFSEKLNSPNANARIAVTFLKALQTETKKAFLKAFEN